MSNNTNTVTIDSERLRLRYQVLLAAIKRFGGEAHARVSAHVSAITDSKCNNIGLYYISPSYTNEEKYEEFGRIIEVFMVMAGAKSTFKKTPEWSLLKGGLAVGDKKPEADDDVPQPVTNRLDPHDDVVVAEPEATEPAAKEEVPQQQARTQDTGKVVQAVTPVNTADLIATLRHALLDGVQLPSASSPAAFDENKARIIAQEEIEGIDWHEQVKKHVSNGAFPTDRVNELIESAVAKHVQRIELVYPDGTTKPLSGLVHPQVTQMHCYLNAGVPVWGWSAAGSGKTHAARQVAELLGVQPYVISVDPTLTVAKLLGYRNVANGEFVEGFLYQPYKNGGLVALDEIDTGDPGVVASINALLANNHYLFPNGETVERHPQFYTLALANTKGTGAVAGYTARNKLDAATLDRFAIIEVKYDDGLESAIACGFGSPGELWQRSQPASELTQRAFVEWVQKVRAEIGQSVLISPRASINGCKLLRAGVPVKEVVENVVTKLCAPDTITRIFDRCGQPEGY